MDEIKINLAQAIKENSEILHIPEDTYKKILLTSLDQTESDVKNMEEALREKDYPEIQSLAHRVKGVYANLRLTDISEAAAQMERAAKEEGSWATIEEAFRCLSNNFQGLKDSLMALEDNIK